MKETRRRYDRAFKISVVAELESGKSLAQTAREHSIHPALPSRWREELAENPEKTLAVMETSMMPRHGLQNLRDCSARLMPRLSFKKKTFAMTKKKVREEKIKPTRRDEI